MTPEKTPGAAYRGVRRHNPYDGQRPDVIPNPGAIRPHEGPFYSPYFDVDGRHEEPGQPPTLPQEALDQRLE